MYRWFSTVAPGWRPVRMSQLHETGRRHPLGRRDVVQRAEAIVVAPPVPVRQLVEPRQDHVF